MNDEVDTHVVVFTDGSASNTGDRWGGWAFVAQHQSKLTFRFGEKKHTSVGEMELCGVIRALQFVKLHECPLVIYSDSQYVVNTVNKWFRHWEENGWKTSQGTSPANLGRVRHLMRLVRLHRTVRRVRVEWVKGHNGEKGNEMADVLASRARRCRESNWKVTDLRNKVDNKNDE